MEVLRIIGSAVFLVFFFGFCIFIHELGHFIAAKMRGLHIIAFSLGFKKFWGKKINGVEYRLGWLPFGGYVELPQIDSTGVPKDEDGKELPEASPVDRIVTAVAGPLFNILFGLTLGCLVWAFGIPQDTPKMRTMVVDKISAEGPEYAAGLREGDKIYRVNGKTFHTTWSEFAKNIMLEVGDVTMDVENADGKKQVKYTPKPGSPFANAELNREKIAYPYFAPRIPITLFPEKGSPAAKAGIQRGDVATEINGMPVSSLEDFQDRIDHLEGKPFNLKVQRGSESVVITDIKPELHKEAPYLVGIQYQGTEAPLKVVGTMAGFPAEAAGIQPNDVIKLADGKAMKNVNEFVELVQIKKEQPVELTVERGDKEIAVKITPKQFYHYTIGVEMAIYDYPNPIQQFVYTVDLSYKSLRGIFFGLAKKIGLTESGSTIGFRNLSGPLGMGRVLFVSVYYGSFMYGIYFVVIISFALAIFNLLPLPVLDGGHTTIAILELVFRRKIPDQIIKYLSTVFIVLLVSLMVYVTIMDIQRFIPAKATPPAAKKEVPNAPAEPNPADPVKAP